MSFPSMVACNILEAYWDKQVPIKPEDIAQAIGIKVILKDLDADMSAIRQKEGGGSPLSMLTPNNILTTRGLP